MRGVSRVACCLALALAILPPVQAQATTAPPFTVGAVKVYAHSSADDLSVWMNTLLDDGAAAPYYLTGASAFVVPVANLGIDPVANQPFEAHIPLTPALTQDLVLDGTVTVQAYIGGGSATAGVANIGTSLQAAGTSIGSAAAKQHVMSPKASQAPQLGTTYDPISWTFTVAQVTIPKGTTLEWIISGTIQAGNNAFLSTYEARGRSYIELPVISAGTAPVTTPTAPAVAYHVLPAGAATINRTEAAVTSTHHQYNWTNSLTDPELRIAVQALNGTAALEVRGNDTLLYKKSFTGPSTAVVNVTDALAGAKKGAWTVRLNFTGFRGNVAVRILETPVTGGGTGTGGTSGSGSASGTTSGGTTLTGSAANGSNKASGSGSSSPKGTPLGLEPALVGLAGAGLAMRRKKLA